MKTKINIEDMINKYKSPKSRELIRAFLCGVESYTDELSEATRNNYFYTSVQIVDQLEETFDNESITTERIIKLYDSIYKKNVLKIFFKYLFLMDFYNSKEVEGFNHIKEDFLSLYDEITYMNNLIDAFRKCKNLNYLRIVRTNYITHQKQMCLIFDTDNNFIQELLIEFTYKTIKRGKFEGHSNHFYQNFGKSLGNYRIGSIFDFNSETLLEQCRFYFGKVADDQYYLRHFYLFVKEKQGDNNVLDFQNGLSDSFISMPDFVNLYLNGYRYYLYNQMDNVPTNDKWMLGLNGCEILNVSDHANAPKKIDFSVFGDKNLREGLKTWFWKESSVSISYRISRIKSFADFMNYKEEISKNGIYTFLGLNNCEYNCIYQEDLIYYIKNNREKYASPEGARDKIKGFSEILTYLDNNKYYKVDLAAYDALIGQSKRTKNYTIENSDKKVISEEDSNKLLNYFFEKSKNDYLYKIYYVVLCLSSITEIRYGNLFKLEKDCLIQKSRPGIYAIRVRTKTNRKQYKDIQVKPEAARLIEWAKIFTEPVRSKAPEELRNYLFIKKISKNKYSVNFGRTYRQWLSDACEDLGLQHYTPADIRTTYFTKIVENAIEQNVDLKQLAAITDHKSINTTERYYVKQTIKDYLEAMFECEIDTSINCNIQKEYKEASSKNIVENGCGYCTENGCDIETTLPCYMCGCNGFITTPIHKKEFKELLEIENKKMENAPDNHTREHCYAAKQLIASIIYKIELFEEEQEK